MPAFVRTRIAQDVNAVPAPFGFIAAGQWDDSAKFVDTDKWYDSQPIAIDPPAWYAVPVLSGNDSITMSATGQIDSNVNYPTYVYFEEISGNLGGGNFSGWLYAGTQNDVAWTDTGLEPNTSYTYRYKAKNSFGYETAWSTSESEATTLAAPSDLAATAYTSIQIDLTWTDPAASGMPVQVQRSPDGSTGWELIHTTEAGIEEYSDYGCDTATQHFYRVSTDGANWSNVDNATTSAEVELVDHLKNWLEPFMIVGNLPASEKLFSTGGYLYTIDEHVVNESCWLNHRKYFSGVSVLNNVFVEGQPWEYQQRQCVLLHPYIAMTAKHAGVSPGNTVWFIDRYGDVQERLVAAQEGPLWNGKRSHPLWDMAIVRFTEPLPTCDFYAIMPENAETYFESNARDTHAVWMDQSRNLACSNLNNFTSTQGTIQFGGYPGEPGQSFREDVVTGDSGSPNFFMGIDNRPVIVFQHHTYTNGPVYFRTDNLAWLKQFMNVLVPGAEPTVVDFSRFTQVQPPPPAPTNLTATATGGGIDLGWDLAPYGIMYYSIESRWDANPWVPVHDTTVDGANRTSWTDTAPVAGTEYFYRIKVLGDIEDSDYSNEASATMI